MGVSGRQWVSKRKRRLILPAIPHPANAPLPTPCGKGLGVRSVFSGGAFSVGALLLVALLATALAACSPGGGSVNSANTAASALDVAITITDNQAQVGGHELLTVGVKFAETVHFTPGETFTCNGRPLGTDDSGQYDLQGAVPLAPVGGAYTFVYTRAGVATTVRIPAPQRLTVVAPTAGATLPRTQSLVVHYTPTQDSASGIVASDAAQSATVSADAAPGNGQFTLPAYGLAKFQPGPGELLLRQSFITNPQHTGFHSIAITYMSVATVHVVWQ